MMMSVIYLFNSNEGGAALISHPECVWTLLLHSMPSGVVLSESPTLPMSVASLG